MARILVIEDEAAIALVLQKLLAGKGHDVTVALDGKSGWEELKLAPPPDLIVVDLFLPGISGRELVKLIRSERRLDHVPIVIVTGAVKDEGFPPVESYQALFEKPFDPLDLVESVNRIITDTSAHSDCRETSSG